MRFLAAILLVVALGGCKVFAPVGGVAEGVTFTSTDGAGFVTYLLTTETKVTRLILSFRGTDLSENAEECDGDDMRVSCAVENITESFEVSIGGEVDIPAGGLYGIVCLSTGDGVLAEGEECFELRL